MVTEPVASLTCGCNVGTVYKTRNSFCCHKRSQRHKKWESDAGATHAQLEIQRMKRRIMELEATAQDLCAHPRKRRVSEAMKKKVAHSQEYRCAGCGHLLPPCYEVDHTTPLWRGGSNDISNLRALCRNCHGCKTQDDILVVD